MTCPHCAAFHETTYPELKKKYIDTGKVRFIFREFPLDQLAAARSCWRGCGDKERYFQWSRRCSSSSAPGRSAAPAAAHGYRKQAGLSEAGFNECLKNQQVLDGIETCASAAAEKLNVQSTPTFFVNGKQLRGAATSPSSRRKWPPISRSDYGLSSIAVREGRPGWPPLGHFWLGQRSSLGCGIKLANSFSDRCGLPRPIVWDRAL